jgi:hypothetical protein
MDQRLAERLIFNLESRLALAKEEAAAHRGQWWFRRYIHEINAVVTLALASGTIALALIAFCSLLDVRAAVERGQQAFELSERAFVVPSIEIMQPGPTEEYPLLAIPTFANAGNSQTVDLEVWLETNGLFPSGSYPSRLDPQTAPHNYLWLGPKQRISVMGIALQIRREDIATYMSNPSRHWILFRGAFQYYDIFKTEGPRHIQRFCYTLWSNPTITGQVTFAFSECPERAENCADAECNKK